MKIAIIGDGALGCLFSAELSKTNEVILLTHTQEKTDIINQNGLSVTETDHHIFVPSSVCLCIGYLSVTSRFSCNFGESNTNSRRRATKFTRYRTAYACSDIAKRHGQ